MTEIYDCNHAVNSLILVVVSNGSVQKIFVRNTKARKKKHLCLFHPNIAHACHLRKIPLIFVQKIYVAGLQKFAIYLQQTTCCRITEYCHLYVADDI